ncbi:MAG: ABC transporter ATP-binding protein [Acidimicrobiia bacterium]
MSEYWSLAHPVDVVGVTLRLGGSTIVDALELHLPAGSFVGLIGPNGSGKSTILRCLYGALQPASGAVLIDDHEIDELSQRAIAQLVAAVPQEQPGDLEITVRHVIELSRIPHRRRWASWSAHDESLVVGAAMAFDVEHLLDRPLVTLSGGERQRVLIARAIAQECGALLLDEPTNHLDIRNQLLLLDQVSSLGCTVIAALHDLHLAARFCTHVIALSSGQVIASGPTHTVLTADTIRRVFGVSARCDLDPSSVRPRVSILDAIPDWTPE